MVEVILAMVEIGGVEAMMVEVVMTQVVMEDVTVGIFGGDGGNYNGVPSYCSRWGNGDRGTR